MLTVLVVEDEMIIRKGLMFSHNWADMGCAIVGEAEDGVEGLEKIASLRPDIVLTDIKMPRMDGLEMLKEANKLHVFSSIVVTSYAEFSLAQRALSLQTVEYLLKPVNEDKLRAAIVSATEQLKPRKLLDELSSGKAVPGGLELRIGAIDAKGDSIENYYVREAVNAIKSRYMERLSLARLASQMHVSESYLFHKFKAEMAATFNDYLNQYRIMKSIELLRQRRHRIHEIAEMTGFTQYKQFSIVFKKYIGVSPTQFVDKN